MRRTRGSGAPDASAPTPTPIFRPRLPVEETEPIISKPRIPILRPGMLDR